MNKVKKTPHVYGGFDGVGNSARGRDVEKSSSVPYAVELLSFPYVDASPYVRTAYANYLGRTSPSVEALMSQAPLNAARRSTLTAFMSDGIG